MTRFLNAVFAASPQDCSASNADLAHCDRTHVTRTEIQSLFSSELGHNLRRV